jgi:hypothetical protein
MLFYPVTDIPTKIGPSVTCVRCVSGSDSVVSVVTYCDENSKITLDEFKLQILLQILVSYIAGDI